MGMKKGEVPKLIFDIVFDRNYAFGKVEHPRFELIQTLG
jgi:hypothetical protein